MPSPEKYKSNVGFVVIKAKFICVEVEYSPAFIRSIDGVVKVTSFAV
jgi:hypothetical protein